MMQLLPSSFIPPYQNSSQEIPYSRHPKNHSFTKSDTRGQIMFESGESCFTTGNINGHLQIDFLIPSAMCPEAIPATSTQLY